MASELLTPTDATWDAERGAFNALIDQRPAGIALPESAEEVAAVVRAAAADGKRVAAQRTGHAAAPMGDLGDTVLLRTTGLGGVEVDADARRARVGAGALWGDVVPAASEQGLAALHGSTPTVSVSGYTLGGGVSFYGRKHGLACNRLTAVELVTADGEQRRVDADNDPDLFWALRGGSGSFGVATALEFELLELPEVYAGVLFFPAERASEVLHAWREWAATAPEEVTSVGRLMNFPPLPEVPEPFRGQSFAVIETIFAGPESEAGDLLAPLRALGPIMDTVAAGPPASITELHMDPPDPAPFMGEGVMTGELPAAAIDALVEAVGPGSGSQLVSAEVRHCGGALGRPAENGGALAKLPGEFLAFAVGVAPVPEAVEPTKAWLGAFSAALAPYASGHYLNFCEKQFDLAAAFPVETLERLRAVKSQYDPENLFRASHPVTS
ncbi:MAG TPA: FAD-binding protein [Solirubrobacterales bacterium]|jgi:FAD/FMN-containing dehydrogenase|nr:FAD-binding protein [Solirubrobacterales bacterium]